MKQNSILVGTVVGVIVPLIAYLLTNYTTLQADLFAEKPIALYVIAAVINLIALRFAYRAGKEAFAKGILLMTFVAMIVMIYGMNIKV